MSMNGFGRFHRTWLAPAALLTLLLLTACSAGSKKELAEQGVAQFHAQLNAGQYHAIYINADERFRKAGGEADFLAFMEAVHRKLGMAGQSTLQSFNINWFAGQGTTVTLFYNTQFSEGNASERFIWRVQNNNPSLVGYNINSNTLITK